MTLKKVNEKLNKYLAKNGHYLLELELQPKNSSEWIRAKRLEELTAEIVSDLYELLDE